MISNVLLFLFLAGSVIGIGVLITRCADIISTRTNLGSSMGGLLLLAGATSLPEYAVGWNCVMVNAPDMAMSGLIGSSLFNLLILSVFDLTTRTRGTMFSKAAAGHAVSAIGSIILTASVLVFLQMDDELSPRNFHLEGIFILLTYLFTLRLIYHDDLVESSTNLSTNNPEKLGSFKLRLAIIGYVLAAILLFVVSPWLAQVADRLADDTGLGETFFGAAFVAAITSLPEVVTTYSAIRMNNVAMAIGNIFGSNAFNMALVGLIDVTTPGSLFHSVESVHATTATAVIFITAVTTIGLLYRAERRILFLEPDAILVSLLILSTFLWIYYN